MRATADFPKPSGVRPAALDAEVGEVGGGGALEMVGGVGLGDDEVGLETAEGLLG